MVSALIFVPYPPRENPKQRRRSFFEGRGRIMRSHAGAVANNYYIVMRVGDSIHNLVLVARIAPSVIEVVDRGRWAVLL